MATFKKKKKSGKYAMQGSTIAQRVIYALDYKRRAGRNVQPNRGTTFVYTFGDHSFNSFKLAGTPSSLPDSNQPSPELIVSEAFAE